MPSRYSSAGTKTDAARRPGAWRALLRDPHRGHLRLVPGESGAVPRAASPGVTEQNIQARIRGNLLMALSNKFGWLVLTTGNKSEMAVGYATLYGDMAGGFAVLKDVPKTLVYGLAGYRNSLGPGAAHPGVDHRPGAVGRTGRRPDRPGYAAAVRHPGPDHRGVRGGGRELEEMVGRRPGARRGAAGRGDDRRQRVQAPAGRTGGAHHAQGLREGPPAAHHEPVSGMRTVARTKHERLHPGEKALGASVGEVELQTVEFPSLTLDSGRDPGAITLAYETYGSLNDAAHQRHPHPARALR